MQYYKIIKKVITSLTALSIMPISVFSAQEALSTVENENQAYLDAIDTTYGYDIANALTEFGTHETLGYRPAGSQAEHEAGEYLFAEMEALGLTNVTQDEFSVDAWTFEKAELNFTDSEGNNYLAELGGYQVNFNTNGPKEYEILYVGKGTEADLEGLDIEGKLLLLDINQRTEWWITYPALQAKYKGAAGIIAVQETGFSEVSPNALNANDFCGPDDAPAFSMSQTDANALKEVLSTNDNLMTVTFDAVSTVERDGTAYNITGEIPGKDPDSYIILSAHYDAYFEGFQDNSIAVGLMMGIAKAMLDSDYQPEKTIIFFAVAAEEWGAVDTRYDWSNGAYNQLFNVRPEWQDQAMFNINFEMPAVRYFDYHQLATVTEMTDYIQDFVDQLPELNGAYSEGVQISSPLTTWADDWSFSIAGIPAVRNDFTDSEFGVTTYHTDFDTAETYEEDIFEFNHQLYGLLALNFDRTAVLPLDFTTTLDAIEASINSEAFITADLEEDDLLTTITELRPLIDTLTQEVQQINQTYFNAIASADEDAVSEIYEDAQVLNGQMKEIFRFLQDQFVRLTWEDVQQYPHQIPATNIENLSLALDALNNGDAQTALDEYLWQIDNNWYAYDFSREVYDHTTDYVINQEDDRLFWGAGRVVGHVDLFDLINTLQVKVAENSSDFSEETDQLQSAIEDQSALLSDLYTNEVNDLQTIKQMIEDTVQLIDAQ